MNSTPSTSQRTPGSASGPSSRKLSQQSRNLFLFAAIGVLAMLGLFTITTISKQEFGQSETLTGYTLIAMFVFLALFNVRKKLPMIPLGQANLWLSAHVVGGIFVIGVFLLHTGTLWPEGVYERVLAVLFYLVSLSGIVGYLLYRLGAPQLTQTGIEVIYERIPREIYELRDRAEQIVLDCTEECSSDTLAKHYRDTLEWYFRKPRFYFQTVLGSQSAAHWIRSHAESVVRFLDEKEAGYFEELMELVRTKRLIDHHYAAQDLMRKWLLVHLPLSVALLIMSAWHWALIEVYAR